MSLLHKVEFESEPEIPEEEVLERIAAAKKQLGDQVFILGHHYQRDSVIQFADATGDSFALSALAAEADQAAYIVFCGVHFMAETADILTEPEQKVLLPDLKAGCSMADMADIDQVEAAWEDLEKALGTTEGLIPITYMNSTATLKAFCGRNEGTVCTSSNARASFEWANKRGSRVLFFPDQHLGRNTAFEMGVPLSDMLVWDPNLDNGGHTDEALRDAKVLLWRGHCSVHQNFKASHADFWRKQVKGIQIMAHPECSHAVVQNSDLVGSTAFIIKTVEAAEAGAAFAIGTEHHLVNRLKNDHPDKFITTLAPFACQCSTMSRIDPLGLMESLEGLVAGTVINQISVGPEDQKFAKVALERMLSIS